MLDKFDELNSLKYAYLGPLKEPRDNSLSIVIEEAGVSEEVGSEIIDSNLQFSGEPIVVSSSSRRYELMFDVYIGYSVLDESYALPSDEEAFEGNIFRIYEQSRYLEYISRASFACNEHPGPFKHYGIVCLNHIVDIVSFEEPKIITLPNT